MAQNTTPENISNAAAAGTCKTTQPGGCTRKEFDDIKNNQSDIKNKLEQMGQGADAAAQAAQLALLNTINTKLGSQLPGGISNFLQTFFNSFNKLAQWLHLDRVLNVLTFAATLHNAYMLSSSLTQTFFSMVSNVLAAVGIKDKDDNPLDISSIVGTNLDNLFKAVLGVETVDGIKTEWKKYSRIYQAAANIIWSLQSIGYSILSALEIIGSWIAWIGNALKKWGTVGEKAYRWMNPEVNFQNRFFTAIDTAENIVSNIDNVASEVLSIQETINQLGTQNNRVRSRD